MTRWEVLMPSGACQRQVSDLYCYAGLNSGLEAKAGTTRSLFLDGPGDQRGIPLKDGTSEATYAAVVCHPHPLYGGTLHNKVVFHAMKALNSFGFPVLRFNFRGAGLSKGGHDEGNGA